MNEKLFDDLYNASEYYRVINAFEELRDRYLEDEAKCQLKYEELKNKKPDGAPVIVPIIIGLWLVFFGFCILPLGLVFVVLGALLCALTPAISKRKKNAVSKEATEFWENEGKRVCEEDAQNYSRACQEQNKFEKDNLHIIEFLPNRYRNYQATSWMALAVANGRADTFKEAANLYEEQLHRWELENINREAIYQQNEIQSSLSALYEQQGRTNRVLQSIEALEYFNAFTRR